MRTSTKLLIGLMLFLGGFAVGGALLAVAAQLASPATITHADATINAPVERIVFFPADMEIDLAMFGEFVLLDDAVMLNENGEADALLVTIPRLIINEAGQEAVEQMPMANGACAHNADQIVLYENGNFQGACKTFNVGDYANPRAMGFANDAASSLRVGGNVKAGLCEHDNFQGACEWLTGDDANLGNNAIGNDRVSSLRVQRKSSGGGGTTPPSTCAYNADQIVLYEHGNYQGACKTFNVGDFGNPGAMGFANDAASSLRVGGNVKAGLCEHDNYQGTCDWFTGDDPDLGNNAIGNDRVSSLRVQRKATNGGGTSDPRQEGAVQVTGKLERGNRVYITINIKNYGNAPTPAIHPYVEGTTSGGHFWRADGSEPGRAVIQPGQTVAFRVQHDLPVTGVWIANGIFLWNNDAGTFWKSLPANGQNQRFAFNVTDAPAATCPSISGWKGEYFGNRNLSGTPVMCRNDGAINFDWGGGAPDGRVPSDNFSVRWTRNASFENARYKFTVAADDGIRLWVNNALVIDQWKDEGTTTYTWEGNLSGGSLPLKVEYYENGGGAVARVTWEKITVPGNDKLRGKKVALDPGHGWGGDPGASANGMLEKHLTLDIANRAKGKLEAYGIQVALTRTGDEPRLGLSSAATRVNQFGANLAVAVHVNAGGGTGTESCYVVNKSTSGASQRLATMLTNQVSRQMGLYNRGDFAENNSGRCGRGRSQLYIHDMDPVTALIETAFIDGPANNDVAKLRDNRDGFAKAISDAIVEYLQSQ